MPRVKRDLDLAGVAARQRAGKAKRLSIDEQNEILGSFDAALKNGMTSKQAAKGLGASLASIYRWQRSRNPAKNMPSPTAAQNIDIGQAIEILVSEREVDRLSLLEAILNSRHGSAGQQQLPIIQRRLQHVSFHTLRKKRALEFAKTSALMGCAYL